VDGRMFLLVFCIGEMQQRDRGGGEGGGLSAAVYGILQPNIVLQVSVNIV